jgi:hypothetical protein
MSKKTSLTTNPPLLLAIANTLGKLVKRNKNISETSEKLLPAPLYQTLHPDLVTKSIEILGTGMTEGEMIKKRKIEMIIETEEEIIEI